MTMNAERQAFLSCRCGTASTDILESEFYLCREGGLKDAQDSDRGVWRRFDAALCRALLKLKTRRRPSTTIRKAV